MAAALQTQAQNMNKDQQALTLFKNKNLASITDYLANDNEHILMSPYSDGWPYLFKLNIYTG